MLRPDYQSIEYQANTRLMDLAEEIADTRKSKRNELLDKAATIRYYLKAVELKTTYLDDLQVNNIYECLIEAADINEFPTVPVLDPADLPNIGTTIVVQGERGERGADGGGTDFSSVSVSIDTTIDSFAVTDAYGARWDYVVYDGTNQRAGSITTTWTTDGSTIATPAHFSSTDIGDTSGIELGVEYFSGDIRLTATVTSGTWTVVGSRYFIPNSGSFQGVSGGSSALTSGYIYIGNSSNIATGVAVSGDITMSNTGVAAIAAGVIVNADISGSAAIAVSKLAALTATKVVVSDASGYLTTSSVTPTELGYLSGVTSNIQTQLDSKVSAASGAISTVTSSDLTINRAVISNGSGKIAVSAVTSTELGYLSGVTSAIQTQINSRVADTGDTMTGALINTSTIEAQGGIRTASSGDYIKTKILQIGDWDMDASATKAVAHGLSDHKKIRRVDAIIRDDSDVFYHPIWTVDGGYTTPAGSISNPDATDITLSRQASNYFDSTNYNATSFNRGWVIIDYIV